MKTDAKLHPSAVSIQIFEQKTAIFARNLTLFYVCKQILGKLQGLHMPLSSIEKMWGKHNAAAKSLRRGTHAKLQISFIGIDKRLPQSLQNAALSSVGIIQDQPLSY